MTQQQLQKIREFAQEKMSQSLDEQHDWDHVLRVTRNALAIAKVLEVKEIDLNLLKAICYLHDIAYNKHKPSLKVALREGKIAYNMLKKILPQFKLDKKETEIILNAVRRHPLAYPFRRLNKTQDVYTKILQDADFIDSIDPSRVSKFVEPKQSQAFFIRLIKRLWDVEKKVAEARQKTEKYLNFSSLADLVESIKQDFQPQQANLKTSTKSSSSKKKS